MTTKQSSGPLHQLDQLFEEYLVNKAPALPQNIKEAIVKFGPWVTLVMLILSIPAVLALFGVGAMMAPYAKMGGYGMGMAYGSMYMASMVILTVSLVIEAFAIPELFKRSIKGWRLMYYASLIGFVSNLAGGNIVGAVIGGLIGFYILFQIKQLYK